MKNLFINRFKRTPPEYTNTIMKFIPILFLILLIAPSAHAGTKYWYGGSGNWTDAAAHWSANSGNSPASSTSTPLASDDVVFDANSATGNYTVTMNAVGTCKNMTWGNPTGGSPTFAGSSNITITGNLSLVSGMTWSADMSLMTMAPPTGTTKTVTSNSVAMASTFTINGAGTVQLVDDLTLKGSSRGIVRTAGTFDANGRTVFLVPEQGGRGDQAINGAFTGTSSFYHLTIDYTNATVGQTNTLNNNINIANTFTVTGTSSTTLRAMIKSSTVGTQRTITASTTSFANVDFSDINGQGTGDWNLASITGGSGDCYGNSNISFTASTTLYWYQDTGNWSDSSKWFLGSGGTGGLGRVPLCSDNVVFDDGSFTTTGRQVTINMPRAGRTIDTSSYTEGQSPLVYKNVPSTFYGSFIFSGVTFTSNTGANNFEGRNGDFIMQLDGSSINGSTIFNFPNGTMTLQDAFSQTSTGINYTNGTFDANDQTVSIQGNFIMTGGTIIMGNNTWSIGTATAARNWTVTGGTVIPEHSTIKFIGNLTADKTFAGGNRTYWDIWNATTGVNSFLFTGSNFFHDFKVDAGRSIKFTAGTTNTASSTNMTGTSGAHITIGTITVATSTLAIAGGGTSCSDWLDISRVAATPLTLTWYAGVNSTDAYNFIGDGWINGACSVIPPTAILQSNIIIFGRGVILKRNTILK